MKDITLIFARSEFLIEEDVFPPLGILYLSSFLKTMGYSVQCLDMGLGHNFHSIDSNLVGISFTTPQKASAYDLLKKLKAQGKTVIAGGPHPTHMSKECLDEGFDYVFQGYAEFSLIDFMAQWKAGNKIEQKIWKSEHKAHLDAIPLPDRDALPIHDYKYYIDGVPSTVIMTSRGCYGKCQFCAKIDDKFHMHSSDGTVDEILRINKYYGFEGFMIFDDVFIASKKRLESIVRGLTHKNFVFRCFGRANLIDEEVAELLSQMGMVEVGIGIESGSQTILNANMKGTSVEQNSRAIQVLRDYGIRAKAFLIVGLPGESEQTIEETRNWVKINKPDDLDISIFQPLPGSPIYKDPKRFNINFHYNGNPCWYKGKPGEYKTTCSTQFLTSDQLIQYRDQLEKEFKVWR